MKTHISNTKALELTYNVTAKQQFFNHQQKLHKDIKPTVKTHHKNQIKITKNNKLQLNTNPQQHVKHLFNNLHKKGYKSTLDNKMPNHYQEGKKILEDKIKKNPKQNYVKNQHEREIRSQKERVQNCKTMSQRKKDKTDPIVNPAYFIKDSNDVNSVTIDKYCQKVLKKNRPSSAKPISHNLVPSCYQPPLIQPSATHTFAKVPSYSKSRPQTAQQSQNLHKTRANTDLPPCTFRAILTHIVENKMFKDSDLKVLYVRLCHHYGEEEVDGLWEVLMDELERF